jgi:hypothetical protein
MLQNLEPFSEQALALLWADGITDVQVQYIITTPLTSVDDTKVRSSNGLPSEQG